MIAGALGSGLFVRPSTTRRVFFSFHYQRDIARTQQIKNHWVTKGTQTAAGYFDGSLEEKAKTEGDLAVKRLINAGMKNSAVTCVLIGAVILSRRWVHYEIFRSVALGKGVFGVRIHNMKNLERQTDDSGTSPFNVLGYGTKERSAKLWPMIHYPDGWRDFPLADAVEVTAASYLAPGSRPVLNSLFRVYDWVLDDGYDNFSSWVDAAAKQAGR